MEVEIVKYKVSVILTLYNSRKFFEKSINSVLNQTFKNLQLVIVDDGSEDNSELTLFPILKKYSNFKYIRHSNRRQPLSLNSGIINSTGEYITFLDSDDEYEKTHIEQRVDYFKMNSSVDLIYSPATIIGSEKDSYVPDVNDNSKLIHINECIIGGTLFGNRRVFEELNGFKDIYSHDSEFYNRAKEKFIVEEFNSPTYHYYRNNPDSITNKMKETFL